jgi:hypothetical protein
MSFVRRLARHAQRLGDLLPGPPLVNRAFHRLALHAVRETSEADDCRDGSGRVFRGCRHGATLRNSRSVVNIG